MPEPLDKGIPLFPLWEMDNSHGGDLFGIGLLSSPHRVEALLTFWPLDLNPFPAGLDKWKSAHDDPRFRRGEGRLPRGKNSDALRSVLSPLFQQSREGGEERIR